MLAIDPGATSVSGPYTGELADTFTDLSDHMLGLAFDFSAETLEYQRWGRETTDSITINKRRLMRIVFIIESGDIASGDDKLMTLWDEAYESDDASFAFIYQHNRKALLDADSDGIPDLLGSPTNPQRYGTAKITRYLPMTAGGTRISPNTTIPSPTSLEENVPLLIIDAQVQSDYGIKRTT